MIHQVLRVKPLFSMTPLLSGVNVSSTSYQALNSFFLHSCKSPPSSFLLPLSRHPLFPSLPFPLLFPANCPLPQAVRKHYSLMFSHRQNTAGDHLPPPPGSPSPPYENYQRGAQAVSGRACCGGNGDLCSSEETASNVITSCQSSYCTVATEPS